LIFAQISAASACAVWSFHIQLIAAKSSRNPSTNASGTFRRSTGIGVEPVVSMPTPRTSSARTPRVAASLSAPRTDATRPST
jgi:hypothetical protein